MNNDEFNEMIRKNVFLETFRNNMLEKEKRYKELLILVTYASPLDKSEYEHELLYNIESHYSKKDFLDELGNKEFADSLKKYIKNHPENPQPDLDFSTKMWMGCKILEDSKERDMLISTKQRYGIK